MTPCQRQSDGVAAKALDVRDTAQPRSHARPTRKLPAELVGGWSESKTPTPAVDAAGWLAVAPRKAMDGRSSRDVGRVTGVGRTTVGTVLDGTTWPVGVARAHNSARAAQ